MKKIILIFIVVMMLFMLEACGQNKKNKEEETESIQDNAITSEYSTEEITYYEPSTYYQEYKKEISDNAITADKGYNRIMYNNKNYVLPFTRDELLENGFESLGFMDYSYNSNGYRFQGYNYTNADIGGKISTCEQNGLIFMVSFSNLYLDKSYDGAYSIAGIQLGMDIQEVSRILGTAVSEQELISGNTMYSYEDRNVVLQVTAEHESGQILEVKVWCKQYE